MVLARRVGAILREAREERKLSMKDVARETNITQKYIEALETEDFSQFPGETYALGFLRNYADYLNIDTEQILNLYRGQQIDQSQSPVQELTRPARRIDLQMPDVNPRLLYGAVGVLAIIGIIALFTSGMISLPSVSLGGGDDNGAWVCQERTIEDFQLPQAGLGSKMEFLDQNKILRMNVDNHRLKLCLVKVTTDSGPGQIAEMSVLIDDSDVYNFKVREGEVHELNRDSEKLRWLARKIKIQPEVVLDGATKILLESEVIASSANLTANPEEISTEQTPTASGTGAIQITLQFVGDSFISYTADGVQRTGRLYPSGSSSITLEANNRLEIKVGNGAGVRIHREGATPRIAGRPAQLVTLTYKMVKDPLDPAVKQIVEHIR